MGSERRKRVKTVKDEWSMFRGRLVVVEGQQARVAKSRECFVSLRAGRWKGWVESLQVTVMRSVAAESSVLS